MADQQVTQEEINKVLEGANFPAGKQDLIDYARGKGATEDVLNKLQGLPEGVFNTTDQLTEALNKLLPIDLKDTLGKLL